MAAGKLKLIIEQGATFRRKLKWAQQDGTPIDLTGYQARMEIRPSLESTTVLATLTTENGGISIDSAEGQITLYISAVDTAAFTWTSGVYDLELYTSPSEVVRLLGGGVTVSKEVTRA